MTVISVNLSLNLPSRRISGGSTCLLGAYFLALHQLEKTGSCFWANLEPAAKGGSRAGHRPPTERNMPVSTPSLAAHAVPLPTLTPHWGSLLGAPVSAPGLCANATFAGVSGRGLRPCPALCHVRCPHSISCVGLTLQEPSAQPRSRRAADILDLLYDVEGLNMCAPAPTSRASHARRLRARARHPLTLCVDPATARLQACARAAAHANLVAAPAAA